MEELEALFSFGPLLAKGSVGFINEGIAVFSLDVFSSCKPRELQKEGILRDPIGAPGFMIFGSSPLPRLLEALSFSRFTLAGIEKNHYKRNKYQGYGEFLLTKKLLHLLS